jgi:murein DD-endopeptidase MepM/ murein hydrolase activator NlpD
MNERRGIRALRQGRWSARGMATAAAVTAGVLIATFGATTSQAAPADFPSWTDVQTAKRDEAAAKAQLNALNAAITAAQAEVDRTQKEAELRGTEYAKAQQAYDEQVIVTQKIVEQQAAAQAEADKAKLESSQLIAGLAKQGGTDLSSGLLDASGADGYLYRIGAMQKVTERTDAVYAKAVQLQNTAQALADQAAVAQAKLEELKADAEAKLIVAQQAAEIAAVKFDELQEAKAKAEALVAFLVDKREVTEADYKKGLIAKWGSGAAGEVSASGWARPAAGYISSMYGMRKNPVNGVWMLHTGVDLAGQGCGAPVYAAHAGTVTYAGWFDSWGYYVAIDHGDGTGSGYAHMPAGGIAVHIGQEVGPGQLIGKVGTTGMSTGCHLHYIVRVHGNTTDPVPFMRGQGINLG